MTIGRLWTVAALVVLAAFVWGCGEESDCVNCPPPPPRYPNQTSPENVVESLAASYERREIEPYAVLLDPEFRFYFQQRDIPADLPRESWNRDEDSTGTAALFNATTEVSKISLDLGAFAPEDANRPDEPGARRIRLTHVKLEVEQFDGTTLVVQGDIQDMYFRRGNAAAGTDSTKWYLFEWRDIPGGGLKPASRALDQVVDQTSPAAATVSPMTWGAIKSRFR